MASNEITKTDLAKMLQESNEKLVKIVDKKIDQAVDNFAVIVKHGFDSVDDRFDKVEKDIKTIKDGQERMELKLDNVAYRFELVALDKRVKFLEKKMGVSPQ